MAASRGRSRTSRPARRLWRRSASIVGDEGRRAAADSSSEADPEQAGLLSSTAPSPSQGARLGRYRSRSAARSTCTARRASATGAVLLRRPHLRRAAGDGVRPARLPERAGARVRDGADLDASVVVQFAGLLFAADRRLPPQAVHAGDRLGDLLRRPPPPRRSRCPIPYWCATPTPARTSQGDQVRRQPRRGEAVQRGEGGRRGAAHVRRPRLRRRRRRRRPRADARRRQKSEGRRRRSRTPRAIRPPRRSAAAQFCAQFSNGLQPPPRVPDAFGQVAAVCLVGFGMNGREYNGTFRQGLLLLGRLLHPH